MNSLDFTFEQTPWECYFRTKQMADVVSAAQMLTLLENEEEQALEDALADLETACMVLDISDLPRPGGVGESAQRLRREMQLAKKGIRAEDFGEGDPLRLYLEEIAAIPVWEDETILAESCRRGDKSVCEKLTGLGLSRVVQLAQEYTGYGVLLLDLIQEGSLGLWQAISTYSHGEYAAHRDRWIRFYLARAVTLQAHASGVGQKMRTALEDYRAIDQRLLSDLGRNPTLEEIAQELHMDVEQTLAVKKMLEDASILARVKQPQVNQEEEESEQAVEDTALFQMRSRVGELLSTLGEADKKLLALRFGLEGSKPKTPAEAGEILGISAEEAVTREAAALAKLRNR